jgi:hypothetical protein
MSKLQITNLQPAGVELFQEGDSFLRDLQPIEAHAIHGGTKYYKSSFKYKSSGKYKSSFKYKSSGKKSSGKYYH